jgi:predicted 3-demethylubiquinone-9 3-methyltransferase (glyoxalase superfamily)
MNESQSMQKITPFLWFNDNAEGAMNHYLAILKNSKIVNVSRYGDAGPRPAGSFMSGTCLLEGQEFIVLNGGPMFQFSPAISLFVKCETQAEINHYWEKLVDGGRPQQCGWLQDRFGVSWQIVPVVLGELLNDPDAAKAQRVMQAMLQMVKLDIPKLMAAAKGA